MRAKQNTRRTHWWWPRRRTNEQTNGRMSKKEREEERKERNWSEIWPLDTQTTPNTAEEKWTRKMRKCWYLSQKQWTTYAWHTNNANHDTSNNSSSSSSSRSSTQLKYRRIYFIFQIQICISLLEMKYFTFFRTM